MLKLNASYSKKVPAEGEYSSQSYHASVEVELPDGLTSDQLNDKIHETFALVRDSVEAELHGNTPVRTPAPQNNPVPQSSPVQSRSGVIPASPKQISYLLSLARQRGVMTINRTSCPDWTRCIGLRNSHDKSFAVGLTAGISVLVCSNLAFGGSTVIRRKHTSRLELAELVEIAVRELEDEFLTLENAAETLKIQYLQDDDEARSVIVRAAEMGVINSSDILPVWREYKDPSHDAFVEPTRWSLLNAFTEVVKKYTPARQAQTYGALNAAFGMDGSQPRLWGAR